MDLPQQFIAARLKVWESLASEKPRSIGRFLKKFGLDYLTVEESIENRGSALERARRAFEVLEAAAKSR